MLTRPRLRTVLHALAAGVSVLAAAASTLVVSAAPGAVATGPNGTTTRASAPRLATAKAGPVLRRSGQASPQRRFLAREDIIVLGLGLRAEPAQQTVPKDIATIVATYLAAPNNPSVPPFASDAEVRATLRGPSLSAPLELTTKPNTPFAIPALSVAGIHTLDGIRLVSGGEVLLHATPESVRIDVIDRLLVTQVTARPLTAQEIRDKGIVFSRDNFQAYNFAAAFALSDGTQINVNFPVVLPTLAPPADVSLQSIDLSLVDGPILKSLTTIIPDTLRIQTQVPNLSVVGFTLVPQGATSQAFYVPPIPGVIVIPGDIGFLNQYFSVMLMVGNVAPAGSNLVVDAVAAAIALPPGSDNVVGSSDDPLRMATLQGGPAPGTSAVTQAGPDTELGTADDVTTIAPGETGSAEFLVEGRREGTHVIEMALSATLLGLPIGPVAITGRAAGAVLVRNPSFTLTFTHPDVVNAGEPYSLDVTVTNTSTSPANFVSLSLNGPQVSGARLVGPSTRDFTSIPPGDSATTSFDLVALRTGRVTAATLDSDGKVAGRFQLKTGIGEFGVPLSPDSLVLPQEASSLPKPLRDAALGLLGRAWAVATAPPAAVPANLQRFSKQIVFDRAVEVAEAGFRHSLGEPIADSAAELLMDFAGSAFPRIAERARSAADVPFVESDYQGFDLVRRLSFRGDVFADAVGRLLADPLAQHGAGAFHRALAEQWAYRPGHVAVLVTGSAGGPVPVDLVLEDGQGRQAGGLSATKFAKAIPFSEFVPIVDASGVEIGQLALVAVPQPGDFVARLRPRAGQPPGAPYAVSVVVPAADGRLQQAMFSPVGPNDVPSLGQTAADPYRVTFDVAPVQPSTAMAGALVALPDPAPRVIGVRQMADADRVGCGDGPTYQAGRIIAVLFSEEVTAASAQDQLAAGDISNYVVDGNRVVGVALQPGRRVVFLALREPIGPFVPRTLLVRDVMDRNGQPAPAATHPIQATVTDDGGVVTGQVLNSDGTPAASAEVRLFYEFQCAGGLSAGGGMTLATIGVGAKTVDAQGAFSWDYVLKGPHAVKLVAIDTASGQARIVRFTVSRNGQRLNVNAVLLGRGTFQGRTFAEDGRTLLAGTALRVTSLTDQSQYGATTDAAGAFEIRNIPVGNILVEAINTARPAQTFLSETIPFASAVVQRDLVLLDLPNPQTSPILTGHLTGAVVRSDGVTPVFDVPVVAYYETRSQAGVRCPIPPGGQGEPFECPVAVARTGSDGRFALNGLASGRYRVNAVDQATLSEGVARVAVPVGGTFDFTILTAGGLGTVRGVVLDRNGLPVSDAQVGGGLSITTVNAQGQFVLSDVPIGRREIVAVSAALGASASQVVDLVSQGDDVSTTIVFPPTGGVAGVVRDLGGARQPGINVYVFHECFDEMGRELICLDGQARTDANGAYRIDKLGTGSYSVSAFTAGLRDGNVVPFAVRFHNQIVDADITFRGGGGSVTGTVLAADGVTPLAATVSISGDQLVRGGETVGIGYKRAANYKIVQSDITTGQFRFDNVLTGPFTVRAAGAFSPDPVAVDGVMPAAGVTVNVNLRLQPTSTITGTVFLPDGVTPAGPDVSLEYKSEGYLVICTEGDFFIPDCQTIPQGIQQAFAVTDANGRFAFPIVNAGPFSLKVIDPASGRTAAARGTVRAGETLDLGVRLLGIGDILVTVVGSDGITPIPAARVVVQHLDPPNRAVTVTADNLGSALFTGGDAFHEGAFVVLATDLSNGFTGRASGRVTTDGEVVAITVRLHDATGTIAGTVFRSDGLTPVANAEVIVSNAAGPLAFAVTAPDGTYAVQTIPIGAFTIEAFDAATAERGRLAGSVDQTGQMVPANIRLEPPAVVRGVVFDEVTLLPLKGWEVTLNQTTPTGRGLPELRTSTGVDGVFVFPGATVGSYSLAARRRGIVGTGSAQGSVTRAAEVVEVPIAVHLVRRVAGAVSGTVFDANGSPAPSPQVTVCPTGEPCRTTTAQADGTFAFADVPLGRFTVTAAAQVGGNITNGETAGAILFESDTAVANVVLVGLGAVTGQVEFANGAPAPNALVRLEGQPGSGCPGACHAGTDANGQFSFANVPARTFTVSATDAVSGLRGSAGDTLNPGQTRHVRIVLAPSGDVRGRVLLSDLTPAQGAVIELAHAAGVLYTGAAQDGTFLFAAVPIGPVMLTLRDPVGPGIARRSDAVTGDLQLGDVVLDELPPAVVDVTPPNGAIGVPRTQELRATFSESLMAASVTPSTVSLVGPGGPVAALLTLDPADTVLTIRPLSPLADQARHTLRIAGVEDRVGKVMQRAFVSTFTTVDITAPSIVETTPVAASSGVTHHTTVRVKWSEPIDPMAFAAPPIGLTGPAGPVAGRTDYLFGNTVAVFTPAVPLVEDTLYQVQVLPAADPAQNQAAQPLAFSFTTTDRTPPVVGALVPTGGQTVIENATKEVVAAGLTGDVVLVDFYLNGVLALADRTAPFAVTFQATPALGVAGQQVVVTAFATDTSGNRTVTPATATIDIVADVRPAVGIIEPAAGTAVRSGDSVIVRVRATDDLGLQSIGYRPTTGNPADAAVRTVAPGVLDRTETFTFTVPSGYAPGPLTIDALTTDVRGQSTPATPVVLQVTDASPPVVRITGNNAGAIVRANQSITVVVSATDAGLVGAIGLTASGAAAFTDTRAVNPAQPGAATAFTFAVSPGAAAPDQLVIDAFALDQAGNRGVATRVTVPVADVLAPSLALRPANGRLEMVPGQPVTILADVTDETGVTRVDLTGSGAFALTDAAAVSPPSTSATVSFVINVPAGIAPGSVLTLTAHATDGGSNQSAPASLDLVAIALPDLTLPASATLRAGETADVTVQLAAPAPAGGLTVSFDVSPAGVATVQPSVTFPDGATSGIVQVQGVAGGTATLRARIQGVERAAMTVTVIGGVVRGTVTDASLQPVAGAQVTVFHAGPAIAALTDASGAFLVQGVQGTGLVVRASDDVRQLLGQTQTTLNVPGGSAVANVVVLSAGIVQGTAHLADGATPAGANVRLDLFEAAHPAVIVATVFSDAASAWQFPLVALGDYVVESSDVSGRRGRATASVTAAQPIATVPIAFLGRGTVMGTVRNALGGIVPNAQIEFRATSVFGAAALRTGSAAADGTFQFDQVLAGTFIVSATDPVSSLAGSASGAIAMDLEAVTADVTLDAYANLSGIVFRSDGVTNAGGLVQVTFDACTATFTANCAFTTTTDSVGRFTFSFMPFQPFTLRAHDPVTRGRGIASGAFSAVGGTDTLDVTLAPQGALLVTVRDTSDVPIAGVAVRVTSAAGGLTDELTGVTDAQGVVALARLLAGAFTVTATQGSSQDSFAGVLAGGDTLPVSLVLGRRTLTSITVAPSSLVLAGRGASQVLTVTGHYSDATSSPLATGVTFGSSAPAVADVSAGGLVVAGDNGAATISVTTAGVPAVQVPVLVRSLVGIAITPGTFTLIGAGSGQQLAITGTFSDGSTTAIGAGAVTFGSSDPLVATVNAQGLVQATGLGSATISATLPGLPPATATASVDIRRAVSIAAEPVSLAFTAAGAQQILTVRVQFNDSTTELAVAPIGFATRQAIVATVSPAGVVTAVGDGATFIDVTAAGFTTAVPVSVVIPTAVQVPVITALGRLRAGEGDVLTIHGQHFSGVPADNLVTINGVPALVQGAREDRLIVVIPDGATTGPVQVAVSSLSSNTLPLAIYARVAEARLVANPMTLAAAPGQVADFGTATIDVRTGDVVVLSGHPNTSVAPALAGLVGPEATGILTITIDGGQPEILVPGPAPIDLTTRFATGPHQVTLRLQEVGGQIATRGLAIVSGPAGTGALVGTRWMTANGVAEEMTIRFKLPGVPDGQNVTVTADAWYRISDGGWNNGSAGGSILNGVPTPNDGRFRTLTVTGGEIEVLYSDAAIAAGVDQRISTFLSVVAADAAGNRTANTPMAVAEIRLGGLDSAAVVPSATAQIADGIDRPVPVAVSTVRDANGRLAPDGTRVGITAQAWYRLSDGGWNNGSTGGTITGGVTTPNDGRFRTFVLANGATQGVVYSPIPVQLGASDVRTTVLSAVTAGASDNRLTDQPFGADTIRLSSVTAGQAVAAAQPPSLAASHVDNRSVVTIAGLSDAGGTPIPDGTNFALTASPWYRVSDGGWNNGSAGGSIVGGAATPNDGRFRTFALSGGQIVATYSAAGLVLNPRTTATTVISLLPADVSLNRVGERPILALPITLAGISSASIVPDQSSVVADGGVRPVRVVISSILDALGNPVPDGTKIALTANAWYRVSDGGWHNGSAGGAFIDGVSTPNDGRFRTYTVVNGRIEATYSPNGLSLGATDVRTAIFSAVVADASDSRVTDWPFASGSITLSSATQGAIGAAPSSVLADGQHRFSEITITGLVDVAGQPLVDGTKVAITASAWYRLSDGGWNNASAGGAMVGGDPTPNDGRFRTYTVTNQSVTATYSTAGIVADSFQTLAAIISVLPADPAGNRIADRPFLATTVTLAGMGSALFSAPATVAPGGVVTMIFSDIRDALGNVVPDGTRVALTAQPWYRMSDGGFHNGSAGGTFIDGAAVPNDGRFRSYVVTGGQITATFQAPGGHDVTTVISAVSADGADNKRVDRPFAIGTIRVLIGGLE